MEKDLWRGNIKLTQSHAKKIGCRTAGPSVCGSHCEQNLARGAWDFLFGGPYDRMGKM